MSIPIYKTPLNRELRDVLCILFNGAKKEVVWFTSPETGLTTLVVDRKHVVKYIEPESRITFFYVDRKRELLEGLKLSTLETLYEYNPNTEEEKIYAEFEMFKDGSYKFEISENMDKATNRLQNLNNF